MIKITEGGKTKKVTNKKGLASLRKANPKEKFRIAFCKEAKVLAVQVEDKSEPSGWLCLHD